MTTIDQVREGLRDAASRRARAHSDREAATEDLVRWLEQAREAGMSMTEAADLGGIHRVSAYELLDRD